MVFEWTYVPYLGKLTQKESADVSYTSGCISQCYGSRTLVIHKLGHA